MLEPHPDNVAAKKNRSNLVNDFLVTFYLYKNGKVAIYFVLPEILILFFTTGRQKIQDFSLRSK